MSGPMTAGLSLDQAPPLWVPLGFFALAPWALVAAGAHVAWHGPAALGTHPLGLVTIHLGTLGFLAAVMFGALYQMTPVVAGQPVPGVRWAAGVLFCLGGGLLSLVLGFLLGRAEALAVGASLLAVALAGFALPVGLALSRAERDPTVVGMRVAVAGLVMVGAIGVAFASVFAGASWAVGLVGSWPAWRVGHVGLGAGVWVGGLIAAVSWQVVPMFYLAPPVSLRGRWMCWGGTATTLAAVPLALVAGAGSTVLFAAVLPSLLSAWFLHPLLLGRSLEQRRRKRSDPSVQFWQLGLGMGGASLGCCVAAWLDPAWAPLLAFVAIWGWAGSIVFGMLTRIVPFLVWFHLFSPHVGLRPVPPMRALLPVGFARRGFEAQLLTTVLGILALGLGSTPLAHALGVGMAVTGVVMLACGAKVASVAWKHATGAVAG
jgi:hypothetical protein